MTTLLYNEGAYGTGTFGTIGDIPTTYDECLELIRAAEYKSVKLRYIALLPGLRGSNNPSYELGLNVIAGEADVSVVSALTSEIFTFVKPLTELEKSVFSYLLLDYVEKNPGLVGNEFTSFVGEYPYDQYA